MCSSIFTSPCSCNKRFLCLWLFQLLMFLFHLILTHHNPLYSNTAEHHTWRICKQGYSYSSFSLSRSSHILQMSITAAPWRWEFIRLFQQHFVQQGKRGVSTMIKKPIHAVTNRLLNLKSSLPCCSFFVTESWTICPRKCRNLFDCFSRFCCFWIPFLCNKNSIMQTVQKYLYKYKMSR